ncbi:hypothetical protein CDG81_12935 [Actinopolyspora erythraea]|uniref:DNA ligase (ATP) n=1 Tax=Actinopolyspora erythraea TaxID=414996 RepID=A0A223RT63_9ACTN|nr:hypothetical protein [Actinopolyspora erythraea]ASU79041.1 hypothetical protein CDG81_12935 [Actinopolyspora erythraea]
MNELFERLSAESRERLRERSTPGWSEPTLTPLAHEPFSHPDWLFESKLDDERYHQRACARGWEGTLAKDATAPYEHGRSRSWLKFKCVASRELVIGGFTEPTGNRPGLGALLVGYAGKVGTGFDETTLGHLRERLDRLEREHNPFAEDVREHGAHWVVPELVAQVSFTEWPQDGKLRHPSYQGLRRDKEPSEVTRERGT